MIWDYTEQDQDDSWINKQMEEEQEQAIIEEQQKIAVHLMQELVKLQATKWRK